MINTKLSIKRIDAFNYVFQLNILNSGKDDLIIPISKLSRSGVFVGIQISNESERLEAVSYQLIAPSKPDEEINLIEGESYRIEYSANIKKVGGSKYGLDFKRAMYLVELGKKYMLKFSFEGIVSDEIEYVFNVID
jgi:hypothetical protein